MLSQKEHRYFFDWLKAEYSNTSEVSIRVIEKLSTIWELNTSTSTQKTIESIHPPLNSIKYKGSLEAPCLAVPLKNTLNTKDEKAFIKAEYLNQLIEQKNYTNLNFHTIGKQTERIENLLQKEKPLPLMKNHVFRITRRISKRFKIREIAP